MNQAVEPVEKVIDRVACLVASLSDRKLLLPITAVAEVINSVAMLDAGGSQTPVYGWINWRNQKIPLVSLENVMGGDRPPLKLENRMAVLNTVGGGTGAGFYAILLQSLPTPVQVSAETIRSDVHAIGNLTLTEAVLGEESVIIPDLVAVEAIVNDYNA